MTNLIDVPPTLVPSHRRDWKPPRWFVIVGIALVTLVAAGLLALGSSENRNAADDTRDTAISFFDQVDRACASSRDIPPQFEQLCNKTPGARSEVEAAAPNVVAGTNGTDGSNGIDGTDGVDGSPGTPGRDGVNGAPGAPGANGADGLNGADGSAGGPGNPGRDGVDGAPGAPGEPGANGADGAPGEPPVGWTFTAPTGETYRCDRAADFDPTAPNYTCSQQLG